MAVGARTSNTMEEFMRKMLGQIADAKTLPDADLNYLVNLETQILGKIRQPIDNMQAAGTTGVPGAPSMMPGMPPGMPPGTPTSGPGMPPGGAMGSLGGPPGGMPMPPPNGVLAPGGPNPSPIPGMMQGGPQLPPMAELARVLGTRK